MEKALFKIIEILKQLDIKPVVYGSFGVACYLGNFKKFGDIDLLIDDQFIGNDWEKFNLFLLSHGFVLIDEKEHEYLFNDLKIGFAKKSILIKDKIVNDYIDLVKYKNLDAYTLQPKHFLAAYRFSLKDGYRVNCRMKKDQEVIDKLLEYIS